LVGVVVTIFEGSSYDDMFREVRPVTVPGERVSTYSVACSNVGILHTHLSCAAASPEQWREQAPEAWRGLVEEVRQVPADSVVFNWECCSGCGDHEFPRACDGSHSATMPFMGFLLDNGFTVMCSDFSLKSLIHEWSEQHLGPNPFLKLGSCDEQFCLEFVPADLQHEDVPQQLQVVGELCAHQGKAVVQAMSSTIVYTVNPKRSATNRYDVKVLTVVTEHAQYDGDWGDDVMCSIGSGSGEKKGTAGHVALTYKGGGQLITSNGHWIELTRIDTSVDAVMRVAAHNFGEAEAEEFRKELSDEASESGRAECVQKHARKLVQQSVASRMKSRSKY